MRNLASINNFISVSVVSKRSEALYLDDPIFEMLGICDWFLCNHEINMNRIMWSDSLSVETYSIAIGGLLFVASYCWGDLGIGVCLINRRLVLGSTATRLMFDK